MKKTIKSLLAIAITAFAFTACSDVPAPYDMPGTGGGGGISGGTGTGQVDDPFNIAAAIAKCKEIGGTESTEKYYVKGIVVTGGTADGTYGNVTFDMADEAGSTSKFKAFQVLGSDAKKLPEGYEVKTGDEVIVYGPIYNYNGKTPETAGKGAAFIYSINGKKTDGSEVVPPGPSVEPKGTGTKDDPFNIAAAIKKCQEIGQTESAEKYYVKGIAAADAAPDGTYGNATIDMIDKEGSTDIFKAFQVLGTDGKKMPKTYTIAKGSEVVVYGPIYNYKGNTPETAGKGAAYIVTVNGQPTETAGGSGEGGGGDVPSGDTDGTEAKPYTVNDAIAAGSGTNVFVKAYLVGWIEGQALATGAHFNGEATVASNILIADSPDETDVTKCMPIQLPGGSAVRSAVNLVDNPGNYKKEILLVGNIEKYFGVPGLKSTSYAKIGDTEAGTKPGGSEGGGGDTPTPGDDILNASFAKSQGDFTIEDKDLGDLTYVWKADSKGYMKASAFANSTNHAAESWLISPAFSLKNATAPVMTFNNACNYVKEGTITDHIKVMVFDGANWAEATIANLPNGSSWTFVDSTVDLKAYAGKENVKVAFKYVSTTAVAPTWEIKTVIIK